MLSVDRQSVRLHTTTLNSDPSNVKTFTPSRAPAFDVCWGASTSSKVYSGGLDRNVVEYVLVLRPNYSKSPTDRFVLPELTWILRAIELWERMMMQSAA